jgi:hypothetical protein
MTNNKPINSNFFAFSIIAVLALGALSVLDLDLDRVVKSEHVAEINANQQAAYALVQATRSSQLGEISAP